MLPIALDLIKALPTSLRAFGIVSTAYTGLKRFDDWGKLVQARRAEHPDELRVRSRSRPHRCLSRTIRQGSRDHQDDHG